MAFILYIYNKIGHTRILHLYLYMVYNESIYIIRHLYLTFKIYNYTFKFKIYKCKV